VGVVGCLLFEASILSTRQENGMADNKKKRGGADRGLIALSEPYEVAYWTEALGVTEDRLRDAVGEVGHGAEAVRAFLEAEDCGE